MSMPRAGMNDETDQIAGVLMQAWEDAEGEKVSASYIATFADMAKAVQDWLDTHPRDVVE